MTREQFLAYDRAKQLERIIRPANDNSEVKGGEIYMIGIFDGVLGCSSVLCVVLAVFFSSWGL